MKRFKNKQIKETLTVAALLCLGASLSGCGGTPSSSSDSAAPGKPLVLTTFTVLQDMAQNVAGDHLEVRSITKPGAEIHDYQPTPSDLKSAQKAKLILNNGLDLERWFTKFTADLDAKKVNVSQGVEPIPITEGDYKGKPNPHAWISPKNGALYVKNMAKAFCDLDAKNCSEYQENAKQYGAKIEKVGEDITSTLSQLDPSQRTLVSCEGAFSYLTRDYNLNEKFLWGVNAEGALTPSRVAEVEDYVKQNHVPAVFCESTVGDKMRPVVEATGAKFGGELYVDSLSDSDGDVPTYLDLLRYDADLITRGLTQK